MTDQAEFSVSPRWRRDIRPRVDHRLDHTVGADEHVLTAGTVARHDRVAVHDQADGHAAGPVAAAIAVVRVHHRHQVAQLQLVDAQCSQRRAVAGHQILVHKLRCKLGAAAHDVGRDRRHDRRLQLASRRLPQAPRLDQIGTGFLDQHAGKVEQLHAAARGLDHDAVADAEQFEHVRGKIDQQPGVLSGDDPTGAGGWTAGHKGFVAHTGEIVHGVVDIGVGMGDGDARFHMVAGPAIGRTADAGVVDDARHADEHAPRAFRVRSVG